MKLTIESADNGYVLSYVDDAAPSCPMNYIVVEEEKTDVRTMQKLLWSVIDYFGVSGSKHDDERIHVVLKNPDMEEVE